MFQTKAEIIHNKRIQANYFYLSFNSKEIAREAMPGQFVDIRIGDNFQPLLRRPFSIHDVKANRIEIIYEVVGCATEILAQKNKGERLDILGPLGRGFDVRSSSVGRRLSVIVGGGMGVAPLFFLARKLTHQANFGAARTIALIGAKTKSHIICEKKFKELGCDVRISTDDGSGGFKGRVTGLLRPNLLAGEHKFSVIYACGPKAMLKEIALLSDRYNIAAQISLEEHMACGIGACLGCVVKTKDGYKRVCKEGPVFPAGQVIW